MSSDLAEAAFIVSRESSGTAERIEAVVASERAGTWYERVVVTHTGTADDAAITCSCPDSPEAEGADCSHAHAVLVTAGRLPPDLGPEYRRITETPTVELAPAPTPEGTAEEGDWFDLNLRVTVEDREISFSELFTALARGESVLILEDNTYLPLNTPELEHLRLVIEEARTLNDTEPNSLRLSRYQVSLWEELTELDIVEADQNSWWRSISELTGGVEDQEPPEGLNAELRDYQKHGYSWLSFLRRHQLGGILADDMGLGKTLQALAMIQQTVNNQNSDTEQDSAPFLIIAPTSVVSNWEREAARFTPGLTVAVLDETLQRSGVTLNTRIAEADLVITSYALFRMEAEKYQQAEWAGLILDEAQMIKNPASQGYRAARDLKVPFTVAITGTPMENNLLELWSVVSLCCPGLLGTREQFTEGYRKPIEKQQDRQALQRLQQRLSPFLLRRTKETVAAELPPKQEQILELELTEEHRRIYDRRLQRERARILGLMDDLGSNRFKILQSLTLLRQLALDASLVENSQAPSAKLEALGELLSEAVGEGHRVLVLSQFTRFLTKARATATDQGLYSAYLDGSTTNRGAVIDSFRSGEASVFFVSLKAGGFGLNLTEADYVILLDPWWNPAVEEQAIDRAHRIGQRRNVMVYRLVAKDTIESKVMALKESKSQLFSQVLDSSEAMGRAQFSAEDIHQLLS
ncbi:DEAD/DEAH box helicase [Nesterenkonia sp. MY13]|uniref:DEAD/DEAH box helicase n=1 Tax=Nesterenkonia sedimenti TaxID=1463632 RepID=A0A7X8TJY5_9MICC|nr:DEAD/DEAH box helicase [Nesterenkonia sedimenti]NLS10205.1 DEAD/DEAH box helicase [Nesterenkonia sedimenti]